MLMTHKHTVVALLTLLFVPVAAFGQSPNTLTAQEKAQGWQLLFDGKKPNGWHSAAPPPARGRAGAPPAAPTPGRAGAPAAPTPGQVGTPKPCTGAGPAVA